MGKRLRKLVSILLVLVMIIGMCPDSIVMAEESSDSGVTATATDAEDVTEEKKTEERDAEEDITEESNTEESDFSKIPEKNDISTETDAQADEISYPEFNPDPVVIDGVKISVSAPEGVFPEGSSLSVAKVSNAELSAVEEALDEKRNETEKVAVSYTYDIKVFDQDGNELQPEDGADVKVSFSMAEVANENLETNVYHISEDTTGELSADVLAAEEDGTTVSASTDGFSYYTVEFTYDEKQYIMQGDTSVALVDILSFVGITKADGNAAEDSDISAVSVSDEELFSASNESGEWIVTAHQAFTSTEWMKVTVDEVEYEIVVTDAQVSSNISTGATYKIDGSSTYSIIIPKTGGQKNNCVYSSVYDGETNSLGSYSATSNFTATIDADGTLHLKENNFTLGSNYNAWRVGYASNNYYFYRAYVKADQTWTISAMNSTYTGSSVAGYTLSGTTKGNLTLAYSGDGITGTTSTAPTNVGSYHVIVTYSGDVSYNSRSQEVDFSITKANISPSVIMSGWTYGNTASNPSVSGNPGGGAVTYQYKVSTAADSTYTSTKPTNAGTYTVSAVIAETTNYNGKTVTTNFTISKANITPSVTMSNWTYGGTASNPSVTGNTGNGAVTYTYKVSTAADSTYTSTKPTNAGTYTVRAVIAETTNYYGKTVTTNFTINKANITPSVTMPGWTYGGTASNPSVTGNKGNGTVTYQYKVSTAADNTYSNTKPSNAGTYTVKATIAESTNYYSGTATTNFTISPSDITLAVSIDGWTYGEEANAPSVTGNSGNGAVTYEYKVKDAEDSTYIATKPTNAGTYTVRANAVATANYNGGTATADFTIAKAAIDPTVTITGWTFGDIANTPLVDGNSGDGTVTYKYKVAGAEDGTYTTTVPTNAGDYTVKAFIASTDNYLANETATADFTIARQNITPSVANVTFDPETVPNGTAPSVTLKDAQGNEVSLDEYRVVPNTDDHEVIIKDKLTGPTNFGNYNIENAFVTYPFKAGKASVKTAPKALSPTYSGSGQSLILAGVSENGIMQYAIGADAETAPDTGWSEAIPEGTDAGRYYVWYKAAGDGTDYTDSDADYVIVTIKKATLTVTAKESIITYGDAPAAYGETAADGINIEGFVNGETAATVGIDTTSLTYSFTYSQGGDVNAEEGKDYGVFKITPKGLSADNYDFNYVQGDLKVSKKEITINAKVYSRYYDGTTAAEVNLNTTTIEGLISGESVNIVVGENAANFSDKNAGDNKTVTFDGFSISGGKSANYKLSAQPVATTASIWKKRVSVSGITASNKEYDGNTNATLDLTNVTYDGIVDGDSLTVTATGTFEDKNVGTGKTVNISGLTLGGTSIANYELSYSGNQSTATAKITPKSVIITGLSVSEKVYDGTTAATVTGTAALNSIIAGDAVTVSAGTAAFEDKDAGTGKTVTFSGFTLSGEDAANYTVTQPAYVTADITPKPVTVSGITAESKTYDGTVDAELICTAASFGGIVEGDTLTVTATGTFAAAEGDPGFKVGEGKTVNISALALGGASVSNYVLAATGQQETATADITKKALTITADSDEKVYDGTALTKDSYTSTALVTGDVIESVTVTGSQTVVGSSGNVPSEAVIKHGAIDVSNCYNITYANGTLTVTKKVVTITADSDTKVYDGTALTKNSFTATGLAEGDSIATTDITITGSQTVVGTSNNVPSNAVIKNAAGVDVTDSYEISYANGTLSVTKKAVTITADSGEKVYDGTALTKHTYTNTNLAEGDTIESVTFTGSQTVVGTSNNVPSAAVIKNAADDDVTSSYDITYANGTLTVTKKTLTITADSDTKVYDGTVLTKNSYTNTALGSGDTIESVTVTGSQTAAGSSDNVPSTAVIKHGDTDVTSSYEITYANGTLTVTAKPVTITAGSDSKIYDGTALTKNTYTNTELAEDETITSVTVTGSQTNVGESNNVPSAAVIKHDETDVTANYDITYVNGTLTVNAKTVTVTADNKSKGYGEADPEFTATVAGLVGTDTVNYTLSRAVGEDIGEYTITAAGAATQGNYSITYETGKLTIGKATLTITAEEKEKTYGEDDPALTYAVSGLKNGDTEDIVTGALARSAGEDVGTYAINRGTISAGDNYNINYVGANLTINRKVVTVKANDKSKTYGEADPTFTATVTGMANGELASEKLSYTITRTAGENVGTYTITPSGDAEQGNYSITYVNGTLEVTAKPLTITAGSDTKVFDGTALTKNSYTNTALADGDEIESVTVTGSQTNVGNSDNAPSAAVIKNAADDDVTDNYDITYVNGTLTVTAKSVTVKADNKSKVYGDNEPALTATVTGLVGTDSINYNLLRVAGEDIGEYTITPSGDAVQGNYTVNYETGKLTITKATLTITADAQEKTYGDEDPELTYTVDGLKNGDTGDIITGELTRVEGEDAGIYAINQGTVSAGGNYTISYTGANLTINRKAVTVKANDKTKTYGNDDPVFDATVTGMVNGEKASEKLSYTITRTDGEDVGEYTITPNGAAEQGNYSVTFETGTLTIGRRSVTATITGHNNTTVYDASEHSESGYDVSFSDDLYNAAYFMFNGTASAVRTDVGTTNMGLASSQFTNTNDNFEVTFNVTDGYQRITKATNAATVTLVDWTYGKTANEPVVTADFGADTAVYTYYTDEACTSKTGTTAEEGGAAAEGEKPTQAGTYYVKAEIIGTDNYAAASDSISFNINKADITITADDKSGKYKEDIVTLTWQVGGDYIEGDELGITAATTATNTSPVGEYPITLSWNENLNYKAEIVNGTYTITKTDLTVTASAYTGIYDGEEHSITVDVDGNTEAVVYYSDATELTADNYNTIGSLTAPTRKDAGVTTVYYYVSTGNYSPDPVRGSKDITITKKSATITADNGSKVYGEADPELTAVVSGTIGGEELDFTLAREAGEDAKDYTITVTDGDNPNYDVSTVNGTFTINRADVTVAADDKSKNYGDEEPELTATITGLKRNDNENVIDYTLSRVAGENVGNYDITAIGDSTQGNYNIQFASGTLTITEKKVNTPEIKVAVGEYIYDGTDKLPEISVYDGNTLIPVDEYDVNYSDNKDAGTATVTITDKEGGNYTVNGEATFIIKKADQDAPDENTISVKNTTDETSKDGVIEGVNDSMEYSTDGGKTWKSVEEGKTSIDGLGAGEVMIRLKEDKNHNPGASVTVTVPAQGDVEVYLRKIGDAPTITVRNSKAELADKLLSDTEKDSVKAGADVDIYLTEEDITDSISDSDKKLIENALNDGEVAGLYLDVNLYKKVGNAEPVQITDTNGYSIKLGINLPDNLINKDSKVTRSYRVLRLHAGSVKEVTSSYNNSEKIVDTESDRFSIFAIIYKDVTEEKTTTEDPEKEKTTTEEPEKTTTEEPNTEEPTTEKESTPAKVTPPEKQNNENNNANTGDGTPIAVIILIMTLSLGGCAVIIRKKKKHVE